jgi:hypothetical protein
MADNLLTWPIASCSVEFIDVEFIDVEFIDVEFIDP